MVPEQAKVQGEVSTAQSEKSRCLQSPREVRGSSRVAGCMVAH